MRLPPSVKGTPSLQYLSLLKDISKRNTNQCTSGLGPASCLQAYLPQLSSQCCGPRAPAQLLFCFRGFQSRPHSFSQSVAASACPVHCSRCFCSLPTDTQLFPDWDLCKADSSAGSFWLLSLVCRRLPLLLGLTPTVLFFFLFYCSRHEFL